MKAKGAHRDLKAALAFLLPNFLGFVVFTAGPVCFSLVVAFSDWDLARPGPVGWIGFGNFAEMFADQEFWLYFINTGYLMLGMPITIAASLFLAILLTQRLGGIVAYRTMFYLPTFTSGVALMILWKALYSPDFGPVNGLISAALKGLGWLGRVVPVEVFMGGSLLMLALAAMMLARTLRKFVRSWRAGDLGLIAAILPAAAAVLPTAWGAWQARWLGWPRWVMPAAAAAVVIGLGWRPRRDDEARTAPRRAGRPWALEGFGGALVGSVGSGIVQLLLVGLCFGLYGICAGRIEGAKPPLWLISTKSLMGLQVEQVGVSAEMWGIGAREALMIMGIWIGIGGNNMLLYIAALTNIPQELYEAAQIDGAGKWAMFRNVTWPQLAPTTFFIVVMSCIGGLQGGFQQARVMTQGGPAGTTTTLAYYIYTKAFEEFQIGYASAVAWVLFSIIFVVTMVNWKFGAKELSY